MYLKLLASADFTSRLRVPVTFSAGDNEEFVEVMIINDAIYEEEEQFQGILELQSGTTGVVLGLQTVATATIQDDDGRVFFCS